MKEIKSWKTQDGKIFEDLNEANIHENKLIFNNKIDKLIEKHRGYSEFQEHTKNFICENKNELKKIFRELIL